MGSRINNNILYCEQFPLSNKYDPMWIIYNQMGPNPLWLTEFLTAPFDLKPGMRVLDLGCGSGITSVFLAREFGVQVYAVDLWDPPDIKWDNAKKYNMEHLIIPVQADARNLPFPKEFFDAVICVDSYNYYGGNDEYLGVITQFLRPGGKIGMVIPGYMREVSYGVPAYLEGFLEPGGDKTLQWWQNLWERPNLISIEIADKLPNGCALWLRWGEALLTVFGNESYNFLRDNEALQKDNGEYIGFIRLIAAKR